MTVIFVNSKTKWSQVELSLLRHNCMLGTIELSKIIKGRSLSAIAVKKNELRKKYDWPRSEISNHVTISKEAKDFIDGLLLGDGSMVDGRLYGGRSSQFTISQRMIDRKEFVMWVSAVLSKHGFQCNISTNQSKNIHYGVRVIKSKAQTKLQTSAYIELNAFSDRWYRIFDHPQLISKNYRRRLKVIPVDVNFSNPVVWANWIMTDGTKSIGPRGSGYLKLCSCGFSDEDRQRVIEALKHLSIDAKSNKDRTIRLTSLGTRIMLDWTKPYSHFNFDYKWVYRNPIKQKACIVCGAVVTYMGNRKYCEKCKPYWPFNPRKSKRAKMDVVL